MRPTAHQTRIDPAFESIEGLGPLYLEDETAWLDIMSRLAREGRTEEFDLPNLSEFLADMAGRDRREVESRLVVLMAHLLKWEHQPDHRSRSWKATIVEQRQELDRHAGRGVLRNHAIAVLGAVYPNAVERAAVETGLPPDRFPSECPYTFEQLLNVDLGD
jgi:hypothetical protein